MNTSISGRPLKAWMQCGPRQLALTALIMLAGLTAYAQTTVTTLTDSNHGKAGYKNGNTFSTAQFKFPAGIALDPSGANLFLADYNNSAIRLIKTVGVGNQSSSYTYSLYTNKNGINHPIAVAVDANTNIFVLNQGTTTKGVAAGGTVMEFSGSYYFSYNLIYLVATNATHLTNATAMALDYSDNIYVTVKGNTVICITPSGSNSVVGVITNKNTSLRGIVVTQSGLLALTDSGNNGIWLMDPNNTNVLGNATPLTGFRGAADNLGPPGIAAFNAPQNIAKAGGGYLVVADYNNGKVKYVDTNGNVKLLYGVAPKYWTKPYPGWRDGTLNDANETVVSVQARQPFGVAVANDGSVFVTETYYNLLREATDTPLPVLPPPPPSVPTIYSAVTNIGSVTLTWSAVSGATSYNVKRSQSSIGPYTTIANTAGTTYTDTSVFAGQTYYYVVSAVNSGGEGLNSAAIGATLPYPAASDPQIGYVTLTGGTNSVLNPVYVYTMNSYTPLVISEPNGYQVNYAFAATSTNPAPTNFPYSANAGYMNGLDAGQVSAYDIYSTIQQYPDVTVWAVASGGISNIPNSSVVSARFIFITANPIISGTNAAEFTITDTITPGAYYYYTVDGSDPSPTNGNFVSSTQVTNSIAIQSDTLLKVRAYFANYQPSDIVSNLFSLANYKPNTACFGFASGPGSSQFVASPGQSFIVPVGLDLLDTAPPIYGLQFNLTVTNLGSHAVAPGDVDFVSLLGKPDPYGDGYFYVIPPFTFISSNQPPPSDDSSAFLYDGNWYQDLTFNDANNLNLLGVGWLEIYGRTNLYNTLSQNLLTYPIAYGTDITATNTKAIVGGYIFGIPANADVTDVYQIQIGRPSATTFPSIGYGVPVSIDAPANTNLLGPGSENALKNVTIGQIKYLVGDVDPVNWYNAGDFGSSNLVNVDVERVFDFAAYPIAAPPVSSDLFDAMDSCGNFGYTNQFGYYTNASVYPLFTNLVNAVTNTTIVNDTNGIPIATNITVSDYSTNIYLMTYYVAVPFYVTNVTLATPPASSTTTVTSGIYQYPITPPVSALFDGNDTNINQIAFGDGVLDICDVYVTYRRSLDPSLLWFERFWTNGVRAADTGIPNHADHVASKVVAGKTQSQAHVSHKSSVPPQVTFTAGTVYSSAGKTVKIPITATVAGSYPLCLLMLNLNVVPLNGAPPLTSQVQFNQTASVLGDPYLTSAVDTGNYAAVWLNSGNAGITNTAVIGNLSVKIPAGTPANAAYGVFFDHASASPNGLASFPIQTVTGTIFCKKP